MRIRLCLILTLIAMLWLTPAWAQSQPANAELRAKVAALYANEEISAYILTSPEIDSNWLSLMLEYAQKPDARFFFLAVGAIPGYENKNETLLRTAYIHNEALTLQQTPATLNILDAAYNNTKHFQPRAHYAVYDGENEDLWCVEKIFDYEEYIESWQYQKARIWRWYNNKLYNLTPNDFLETDFFNEPNPLFKDSHPNWQAQDFFGYHCHSLIDFAVNTDEVPFKLRARLNNTYWYSGKYKAWSDCVPDYEIEYLWDGDKYVRGAKVYQDKTDMPELRQKVAAMFTDAKEIDKVLNDENVDYDWLKLMSKHAETPDARLFFLAFDEGAFFFTGIYTSGLQPSYLESEEWNTPTNIYINKKRNVGSGGYGLDVVFETVTAADGSIWCVADCIFYEKGAPFSYPVYILRFADGKFYDVTPKDIADSEFYESGKLEYPPDPYEEIHGMKILGNCEMYVTFEVDKNSAPFKLKALAKQLPVSWYAGNVKRYECVPQCYLEYAWDGAKYVQTGRVCAEDGWGIFAPEPESIKKIPSYK